MDVFVVVLGDANGGRSLLASPPFSVYRFLIFLFFKSMEISHPPKLRTDNGLEIELKEGSEGDWAQLSHNIHELILDRLVSLADYVRYGAVCKPWLGVSLEELNRRCNTQLKKNVVRSSRLHNHNHQLPMLMVPHRFDEDRAGFYSVTNEQKLKFELSVPYHQRFIGSSLGWLISVDTNFDVTLFNPFCSDNNIHHIPAIKVDWGDSTFDLGSLDNILFNHEYYIVKAVLSADPNLHPDDYTLAIIYGEHKRLAFYRPRGKHITINCWSYLRHDVKGFSDIIYYDDAFHALHKGGEVLTFKLYTDEDNRVYGSRVSPPLNPNSSCFARYIVEGASGEILQVLRFGKPSMGEFPSYSTYDFLVFKLDRDGGNWVELKSLGDQVLFVGDNSSLSVLASDFPGCEPGALYYSFGFHPEILNKKLSGDICDPCDTAVFNLENRRIRPHNLCYDPALSYAMHQFPPIWVVPTFQAPNLSNRS